MHHEVSHFALNLFINKEKELHIIIQLKICSVVSHDYLKTVGLQVN